MHDRDIVVEFDEYQTTASFDHVVSLYLKKGVDAINNFVLACSHAQWLVHQN